MFQKSETLTSDDHLLIQKEFVYFYRPTDYEDNAVDAEERLFTIFPDVFGPSRLYCILFFASPLLEIFTAVCLTTAFTSKY